MYLSTDVFTTVSASLEALVNLQHFGDPFASFLLHLSEKMNSRFQVLSHLDFEVCSMITPASFGEEQVKVQVSSPGKLGSNIYILL